MKTGKNTTPLRTALIYAFFSALWILVSDKALEFLVSPSFPEYVLLQTIKGWLFVFVSASLIYLILRSDMKSLQERQKHIIYQAGLIEDVSDAIISTDMQFHILSWNTAAEHMYGWTASEVIGHTLREFVQNEYFNSSREEIIKIALEQEKWKGEVSQNHKNGMRFFVSSSLSLVKDQDGQSVGFVAINRDISEHKRAEDALKASEEKYRDLVENSNDLICTHSLEGKLLSVNEAAARLSGYSREALLQMDMIDLLPPQVRHMFSAYLKKIRAKGRAHGILHILSASGETRIWEYDNSLRTDGMAVPIVRGMARDITERRRAEEELRKLSQQDEEALHIARMAHWEFDVATAQFAFNDQYYSLHGTTAEEVGGYLMSAEKFASRYVHPQDAHLVGEAVQQAIETNDPNFQIQTEARILQADGELRHFTVWFRIEKDPQGRTTKLLGVNQDITERKQAEEALLDSQMQLEGIFNSTMDAIVTIDEEQKIVIFNPAAEQMFRCPASEVIGQTLDRFIPEYVRKEHRGYLHTFGQSSSTKRSMKTPALALTCLRADGETFPSEVSISQIELGGRKLYTAILRDVTERKRAEDALRESQQNYATLVDSIDGIVWEADAQTFQFSFVSKQAERLLGYPAERWVMEPTFWQDHIHPDDQKWAVELCAASTREKRSHDFEYRMNSADERSIWLRDIVTVIVENDQPVRLRGIMVDITERKQTQDEIRRLKEFNENLINNMSEGIAVQDTDGYFTFVNPAASSISGYLPQEFVGRHWTEFFPAEQHEIIKEADNRRLAGEASQYEIDFLHKSGERINMLVSGSPLFEDERFNGSMAVFTDITERKQAEKKIRRQIDYLTALQDIDRTIASAFDMHPSLNALISKAVSLLAVDAAAVLLINSTMNTLEFAAGDGFRTNAVKAANVKLGESYAGRAAMKKVMVKIPNLKNEADNLFLTGLFEGEGFVGYYGVPLIVKGKVIGVFEVFQRSLIKRDQEWLDFLNALAGQAAIAISNAQLFDNLQHSNSELIQAYDATIEGWSHAMDLRDRETEGHTLRVTELALQLASLMDISDAEQIHIRRGSLLHDIGKLGVPDAILLKTDKLTDEEWVIMRRHPTHAYEMLSSVQYLKPSLDIPYYHHEKWDGSGYPHGLKADEIPLAARIFAVVDVWDALTNERPYRAAWPQSKAIEYIRENSGIYFDPQVVEVFLKNIIDTN